MRIDEIESILRAFGHPTRNQAILSALLNNPEAIPLWEKLRDNVAVDYKTLELVNSLRLNYFHRGVRAVADHLFAVELDLDHKLYGGKEEVDDDDE